MFGFAALLVRRGCAPDPSGSDPAWRSRTLARPWAGESLAPAPLGGAYFLYYLAFEAFYRGFVLTPPPARRCAGRALAATIMATLIHLGKPLPELLAAAPASLIFGVLALRSRSILYPALLHLIIGLTLDVTLLARAGQLHLGG